MCGLREHRGELQLSWIVTLVESGRGEEAWRRAGRWPATAQGAGAGDNERPGASDFVGGGRGLTGSGAGAADGAWGGWRDWDDVVGGGGLARGGGGGGGIARGLSYRSSTMCQQASALPQTAEHLYPASTYPEEQQHGGEARRRRQQQPRGVGYENARRAAGVERQQEGRPAVGAGDVTSPAAAVRNGMQNGLWVQNGGAESGAVVAEWQQREGEAEGVANGWALASFAVDPRPEEVRAASAVLADELSTFREDAGLEKKEEEVVEEVEVVDYSKLTVPELKGILRAKKLKVSGKKEELIERLNQVQHRQTGAVVAECQQREGEVEGAADGWAPASFAVEPRREEMPAASAGRKKREEGVEVEAEVVDYSKLTVPKLKDILRAKKLKVSGRKEELIERLNQANSETTSSNTAAASAAVAVGEVPESLPHTDSSTPTQPQQEQEEDEALPQNWDEHNAYVGQGEDILVASDWTRQREYFGTGNGRGGGPNGSTNGVSNTYGSSSSSSYANSYGRPPPAGSDGYAGAATTPASGGGGGGSGGGTSHYGRPAAAQGYAGAAAATATPARRVEQEQQQQQQVERGGSSQRVGGPGGGAFKPAAVPVVDPGIERLPLPSMPKTVEDKVEGVQIVAGREKARKVVKILMDNPDAFYACDTEVSEINLKDHGPVGHGRVTCISIYGGPDLDFGEGPGKILWVDNLGAAAGTLEEFLPFFASEKHKKVWHNYGFDRHVMFNSPDNREEQRIDCVGFAGDTMHMARLWDTSMEKYAGDTGFSLEALSLKLLGEGQRKTPMKELFGIPKLKKDGTPGNLLVLPPIDEIQTRPEVRPRFIEYSAYDAQATWLVHRELMQKLREMSWKDGMTMLDFYEMYYVPFGELLTDMERTGIYVEAKDYLQDIEVQARNDKKKAEETFLNWVKKIQPGAETLNPSSSTQIQTLLFGGATNPKTKEKLPVRRVFKIERDPAELEAFKATQVQDEFADYTAAMLKEKLKEMGKKVTGKKDVLLARIRGEEKEDIGAFFKTMSSKDLKDTCKTRGINEDGTKKELVKKLTDDAKFQVNLQEASGKAEEEKKKPPPKKMTKYRELTISSVNMKPTKVTAAGSPAVSMDVLNHLAGNPHEDPPKYGAAYGHFGGGLEGKEACEALYALCNMGSVDTMVSNFLQPLQELVDEKSRVHCSLNLNTETGRLSARKPNLQNQPALEKDQYKIRAAFRAEEGNTLVVADYGQLELRLLAHITDCKSMITAFKEGGCFHSRTAVGMFDHVKEAVDKGEVLLEWDYSKGEPPKPLVKDVFASERRQAKTLNFSIAYGKTGHGLFKDWGVTLKEAEDLVKAWYADRPEVKRWQKQVIQNAKDTGFSRTLMGRYRKLPDITSNDRGKVGHGTRAAINTPIQGGAADVAMVAMIGIVRSPLLKKLGWKLLLQVHDEVILEGPEESAKEALAETVRCMQQPWDGIGLRELRVDLLVDAKSAKTWYDAK
ncbi:pol1-like DNA polymerase [Ectocarpus siliculosus]|uniref:Pol1-like DNA polymerase n=1 Tax=Ectocarpus siliculosus TaxID=2880 RepID=D8LMQ5_ECTSI|nr:pol1-like DNA polymerase [Ectocarpus siliculosus]|eukprot:CBN74706.1 pol1-like DNA polymerase [Ectocarpus siliculosus]